ncbi:MAG TPA: response regulator transcription factor [Actinomycetota bacterium]|nr:response regulator transcription factor [Actinomycetota bacterium]
MPADRETIRVLIAEDHRAFAEALQRVFDLEKGMEVVTIANDGQAAVDLAVENHPDVVLMDVEMPDLDGIAATKRIREASPETQVVILSAHQDDTLVARAVEAGAAGYVSKTRSVGEVADAIRAAAQGESLIDADEVARILAALRKRREEDADARARADRLTPRQVEILQLMADGFSSDRIAERLGISRQTLRTHVQNILTRLRVHSKLEALAYAIRYAKVRPSAPIMEAENQS